MHGGEALSDGPTLRLVREERPRAEREIWTVADVCSFLSVSKTWVYERARKGSIPTRRLGARLRFDAEEIRAWWARQGERH